jgi:hypothetical protein
VSATVLAALALIAVIVTYLYTRRRIQEIHVLVNRRLELALQEIRDLKAAAQWKGSGSAPVMPSDAGRSDDG